MWLQASTFDNVSPQHTHKHVKKHATMAKNVFDEIDLDKELQVFCDVWKHLVSLVENAESVSKFSFTIMIVSINCHSSIL